MTRGVARYSRNAPCLSQDARDGADADGGAEHQQLVAVAGQRDQRAGDGQRARAVPQLEADHAPAGLPRRGR
eukprot:7603795-Pyramimonas_sp.AAC.2